MSRSQSIESLAATFAIVLLLFSPMLDPVISLVAAVTMLVVLIVVLTVHGRTGVPHA